jgi:hypothetical protein
MVDQEEGLFPNPEKMTVAVQTENVGYLARGLVRRLPMVMKV